MTGWMPEPVIVPRAEHPISRRDIDPDALKVLYRLQQFNYAAYLVGGSVRDLLLRPQPKDFDVGTDAHPYQIKKLFRNCWIIGRRFRLAHVRFGTKTIEVATFRRNILAGHRERAGEPNRQRAETTAPLRADLPDSARQHLRHAGRRRVPPRLHDQRALLRHRDVLDHRLRRRPRRICATASSARSAIRGSAFRKIRCGCSAPSRLPPGSDFALDPPVVEAIAQQRHLIATASPARLIEEYYKVLRSGAAEKTFRLLAEHGLLEPITPELHRGAGRRRVVAALARARSLSPAVRLDAAAAHQPGPARHAAACRSG